MEVNRLLGDELAYELFIRHLPVPNTVSEMRTSLRGALRLEREGIASPPSNTFQFSTPEEELNICNTKLNELGHSVENFNYSNRVNEFRRISSRLGHIRDRVSRIPTTTTDMQIEKNRLQIKCRELMATLVMVVDQGQQVTNVLDRENPREVSLIDEDIPLIPELVTGLHQVRPGETNTNNSGRNDNSFSGEAQEITNEIEQLRKQLRQETANMGRMMPPQLQHVENSQHGRSQGQAAALVPQFPGTSTRRSSEPQRNESSHPLITTRPLRPNIGKFRPSVTNQETPYLVQEPSLSRFAAVPATTTQINTLPNDFANLTVTPPSYNPSYVDVSRWRLQFDGDSSVTNFLERIEEMRISKGVTSEQLLRSACELFTKDALLWYRTHRFSTWNDLVTQLKEDFLPYDYEYELWEEIRRRTQGAKEKVIVYISVMENLFNRLGQAKPNEDARIKMIQRNLLPYIQTQLILQNIGSISELTTLARTIEETAVRAEKFCPPPTNYKSLLEPDLAYRKSTASSAVPNSRVATIRAPIPDQLTTEPKKSEDQSKEKEIFAVCWNCQEIGHRFRKCSKPRKRFCFKCGKPNVTYNDCNSCQKNVRGGQK